MPVLQRRLLTYQRNVGVVLERQDPCEGKLLRQQSSNPVHPSTVMCPCIFRMSLIASHIYPMHSNDTIQYVRPGIKDDVATSAYSSVASKGVEIATRVLELGSSTSWET
jgi:hypothetical protein